jgi:hypothetical protein|tara:strand:- start:168 stop:377 length:210 start_codon:yes stop_codon:yes gene_type:complete
MIDNTKLAKYLHKRMSTQDKVNTTFHLIKVPTEDELVFWVGQFRTRGSNGHSEWSERYQRNMWISDKEL